MHKQILRSTQWATHNVKYQAPQFVKISRGRFRYSLLVLDTQIARQMLITYSYNSTFCMDDAFANVPWQSAEEYEDDVLKEERQHGREIARLFRKIIGALSRRYNVSFVKPSLIVQGHGVKSADLYIFCRGGRFSKKEVLGMLVEFKLCISRGRSATKFLKQLEMSSRELVSSCLTFR